jgi:ferritin-like metal-binding protein YciE
MMATLADLFEDTLKDIYYAEKHITKALPKMAKKASSADLKAAFQKHLGETEEQIERLDQVFELLGKPAKAKKCPAIDGILEEGAELLEEHEPGPALDAAMAAAAQAVEHYEIARYGTLVAWATELGHLDAAALLATTLEQEEATDLALSEMATSYLNPAANDIAEAGAEEDQAAMKAKPAAKPKRKAA